MSRLEKKPSYSFLLLNRFYDVILHCVACVAWQQVLLAESV